MDLKALKVQKGGTRIGSNFSRSQRFQNPERFYCNLSGQSTLVGPGAYDVDQSFNVLNAQPCLAKMKENANLTKE